MEAYESDTCNRVSLLFSDAVAFHSFIKRGPSSELDWSSGPRANLHPRLLGPFVLSMNHPPQIGSRVRWWDARGQVKHGSVSAINVLSDNSHVIVIKVEDGQPATVTLPIDHVQVAG